MYCTASVEDDANHYKVALPGIMWNGDDGDPLAKDGGRDGKRKRKQNTKPK
jgi:hypothetical protein